MFVGVILLTLCAVFLHTLARELPRFTGDLRFKGGKDYVDSRGGRSREGESSARGVNGNMGGNAGGMGMGGIAEDDYLFINSGVQAKTPLSLQSEPAPEVVLPIKPSSTDSKLKRSAHTPEEDKVKIGSKEKSAQNHKTLKFQNAEVQPDNGLAPQEDFEKDVDQPCPGTCPVVPERQLRFALRQYWLGNAHISFNCACASLKSTQNSPNMARAIMYALTYAKDNTVNKGEALDAGAEGIINNRGQSPRGDGRFVPIALKVREPAEAARPIIQVWEVLAPLPVGKLEVDADPTFDDLLRNPAGYEYEAPEWSGMEGRWSKLPRRLDPVRHVLTMPTNVTVYSELMAYAAVHWRTYYASQQAPAGIVELRFGALWNELVQGVSTAAVLEFQGWARATTYARSSGSYQLFCRGVHTVYVVNDGYTRLLVGDVYGTGKVAAAVDLRVGPVALVLPLRGAVGLQFSCQLSEQPVATADSLVVFPPTDVPHLLQLDSGLRGSTALVNHSTSGSDPRNSGLLLSAVFTLPILNTQAHSLSLAFSVEVPQRGITGTFGIRRARALHHSRASHERRYTGSSAFWNASLVQKPAPFEAEPPIVIGPGQLLLVPLEIYEQMKINEEGELHSPQTFIFCRKGFPFQVVVIPSRGLQQRVPLEFSCRARNESFLVSYVDHDGSVAQAAVVIPLPVTVAPAPEAPTADPPKEAKTYVGPRGKRKAKDAKVIPGGNIQAGARFVPSSLDELLEYEREELQRVVADASLASQHDVTRAADEETEADAAVGSQSSPAPGVSTLLSSLSVDIYPVLLSLHGTGIGAISQADSYKQVPWDSSSASADMLAGGYLFGVEGMWVVAPTRWGAHNWEGVGELSARHSVNAIQRVLERFPALLPQLWPHDGIVAGHSMGAHGAWLLAANDPEACVCLSATAGWITKEHYASSNAFFKLDVQNSYTQPRLHDILARAMQEYHVDELVGNLQGVDKVHIRVGSGDLTTHPWFSRRMARLLLSKHRHNGTRLEEVSNKEHWWWDTTRSNDGGVMNDATMRALYNECRLRAKSRQRRRDSLQQWHADSVRSFFECRDKNECIGQAARVPDNHPNETDTTVNSAPSTAKARKSPTSGSSTSMEDSFYEDLMNNNACVTGNFAVHAVNLAHSRGACGMRILQQQQQLSMSKVEVSCSSLISATPAARDGDGEVPVELQERLANLETSDDSEALDAYSASYQKSAAKFNRFGVSSQPPSRKELESQRCDIRTQNVLRLSIGFGPFPGSVSDADIQHHGSNRLARWYVNGVRIDMIGGTIYANASTIELCWPGAGQGGHGGQSQSKGPAFHCERKLDSAEEKSPALQGPLRMVASRPVLVVYGTPRESTVRLAMRDLAIYIANAHATAHHTFIRAVTDLEYRTAGYVASMGPATHNIILIGGPHQNKVTKAFYSQDADSVTEAGFRLRAKRPVEFPHEKSSQASASLGGSISAEHIQIGPHSFDADTHAIVFAFPITASNPKLGSASALAVCLSANSANGYMHLSRLAWPTVPPMVRAPFANYIPDFMVIDESVWAEGFGGVALAGYWDTWWRYDSTQAFVR